MALAGRGRKFPGRKSIGRPGMVLSQAMRLIGIGLALGLGGALLPGRAMSSLSYGLSSADTVSLLTGSLTLLLVATIASYLPARRASKIDPAISLREA
jgi:putative ABC transport system permease protein